MQQYGWQHLAAACHYILVEEDVVPSRLCAAGNLLGDGYENPAAKQIGKVQSEYAGCNKHCKSQYVITVPYLQYAVDIYKT